MQIQRQPHYHLLEIRPMIFALAVSSNLLAALAFEIDGRGVKEDQVNLAE